MSINDLKEVANANAVVPDNSQQLPRLGWRNGAKQARTNGFFYIKADDLNEAPDGELWEEATVYDDEVGYRAPSARIACVGYRQQAFFVEETGAQYPTTIWLPRYEAGAKLYTELLCWVDGLDELVSFNIKGMTGKAVTGKGGILHQHKKMVHDIGKGISASFNVWAFWMQIGGTVDSKGQPLYTDTGYKSFVTLPALVPPDPTLTPLQLGETLFVGKEQYADLTSTYHAYKANGWFEQQRGNVAPVEQTAAPVASYHEPIILDEDIPF